MSSFLSSLNLVLHRIIFTYISFIVFDRVGFSVVHVEDGGAELVVVQPLKGLPFLSHQVPTQYRSKFTIGIVLFLDIEEIFF